MRKRKKRNQSRQQNVRQQPKSKDKKILASAAISTGVHTEIKSEDLYNEPVETVLLRGKQTVRDSSRWIHFFDPQYSFLKNLVALTTNSPTLARVLNDKAGMATGDGLMIQKGLGNTLITALASIERQPLNEETLIGVNNQISSVNLLNESLIDVLKQGFYDFFAFGNAFIELIKTENQEGEKQIYAYNIQLYSVAIKEELDMIPRTVGVCEEWETVGEYTGRDSERLGVRELPIYPVWGEVDEQGDQRTVIKISSKSSGLNYFSLPSWIGAKNWAEIEYQNAKYNLTRFYNQFKPSSIIQLFGSLTQEDAQALISDMKKSFAGTGNNSNMFVQVLNDERLKANVQIIEDESDGNFIELQKTAQQAIVTACGWTMGLAGVSEGGKLGSNQQVRQETEYVQNVTIKPVQNLFITRFLDSYFKECGKYLDGDEIPNELHVSISNSIPISYLGDIDIESNLTQNEKREVLGYEEIEQTGEDGNTDTSE